LTRELRSLRPAYLSTAQPARRRRLSASDNGQHDRSRPLTDKERDEIDAWAKKLLREINSRVQELKQTEDIRNQAADSVALSKRTKGGLGALGRWAAGGAVTAKSPEEEREEAERKSISAHRESVIIYLQRRLEEAGRVQGEMMEVRLGREVEKSKSMLYKSRMTGSIPYAQEEHGSAPASPTKRKRQSGMPNGYDPASSEDRPELTREQQQLFAEENDEILRHYNSQLDQISHAEKSILEISELQSTLVTNIQMQSEHIEQLVEDSYLTTENLGKGNKELKRASERRSTAMMLFFSTCGFCTFLVVWDLIF
jgi:syntaxin 18